MATKMVSRSVQELAINGEEPPQMFFYKGSDGGILDVTAPCKEIPVVDISLLTSPSTSSEELEKLRSAFSMWGCIQAVNHGIPSSFLDKVHEVSKQFFGLPTEEKQKYSTEADSIEGYGNSMVRSAQQVSDWADRLYLTVSPEDERQLKFWPQNPEAFRETLQEYTIKLQQRNEVLMKAMARSLKLEDNCFSDQYGDRARMTAKFNIYPPCPRPDLILGVRPHADGSTVTFLLQDKEVEGLQVLIDDIWFQVPVIPEALLINVGDQIEIMSNGIFKSSVHRVVTNSERERITLAVFCFPRSDREIKPADGLISEKSPAVYKKVKDYVSLYLQHNQIGRRPIEAAKISSSPCSS